MEDNSEREAVGRRLFDTHIKPGGSATVSLPAPLRDEIVNAFMTKGFKPDIDSFDDAQRAVLQHMTISILPGFFDEAVCAPSINPPHHSVRYTNVSFV
jgi:hypothetical protein